MSGLSVLSTNISIRGIGGPTVDRTGPDLQALTVLSGRAAFITEKERPSAIAACVNAAQH